MTSAPQTSNEYGVLRAVLERARCAASCSLDTRAEHRHVKWLARQLNKAFGPSGRMRWDIVVRQPEFDADAPRQALVSFDQDWMEATRALIERKAYGGGAP
jgi:hypothetical protein